MKIADNISWKIIQDKVVAVDINTGIYFTMNQSASKIWIAMDEGKEIDDIIALLHIVYPDMDENKLRSDIQEQIEYWRQENLIV